MTPVFPPHSARAPMHSAPFSCVKQEYRHPWEYSDELDYKKSWVSVFQPVLMENCLRPEQAPLQQGFAVPVCLYRERQLSLYAHTHVLVTYNIVFSLVSFFFDNMQGSVRCQVSLLLCHSQQGFVEAWDFPVFISLTEPGTASCSALPCRSAFISVELLIIMQITALQKGQGCS